MKGDGGTSISLSSPSYWVLGAAAGRGLSDIICGLDQVEPLPAVVITAQWGVDLE